MSQTLILDDHAYLCVNSCDHFYQVVKKKKLIDEQNGISVTAQSVNHKVVLLHCCKDYINFENQLCDINCLYDILSMSQMLRYRCFLDVLSKSRFT